VGIGRIARRTALGLGIAAAGGLAVGYGLYRRPHANPHAGDLAPGEATFNPWIRIARDGTITIYTPRAEMGQHIHTTLAALVAEELDADLDQIVTEHGPAAPAYYNAAMMREEIVPRYETGVAADTVRGVGGAVGKMLGLQVTGGSTSTIDAFERMREAGALAREMLVAAAARALGTPPETLRTARAAVHHPPSGRALSYGQLAESAARLRPPATIALRHPRDWRLLGRPLPDVHGPARVTGTATYGIDVILPDMLFGTVRVAPRFGARHVSVERAPALAVPGVLDVVELSTGTSHGFGVIAENTWAAFRGSEALEIVWEAAQAPRDETELAELHAAALRREPDMTLGGTGEPDAILARTPPARLFDADYAVPHLAHACMEPMNATARLAAGRLEIWCGTQAPGLVRRAAARLLALDRAAVTVHTTLLGGGFGRRAEVDFALLAAAMARETRGRPVKVTWSRAEDIRHDAYRPAVTARLSAALVPGAAPEALAVHVACPSVVASATGRIMPGFPELGPDASILDGLHTQPYAFAASRFSATVLETPIPVGFWRAVGNSQNGFFLETFLDEIARASDLDPLDLRLALVGEDPRFAPARAVLLDVTARAGWGEALPEGRGLGLAFVYSFGAWVAQVVEVGATGDALTIPRVWCSADAGRVLDPRTYEAQLVSGIVYGLSAAMEEAITLEEGAVVQSNFHDFPIMRPDQCPEIDIRLLANAPRMGGAGEVGLPPAAPALGNAIFAATGRRLRRLPFGRSLAFA
jgi:isoquinoline 1-oxidoreductase beta subunit